jgi:hypothetical protein
MLESQGSLSERLKKNGAWIFENVSRNPSFRLEWCAHPLGDGGNPDSVPAPVPNQALEPTPYSLRYASAFGRGSPPAFGRADSRH